MTKKLIIKNVADLKKIRDKKSAGSFFVELPIHREDISIPFNDSLQNDITIKKLAAISDALIDGLPEHSTLFVYGSPLQLMKFHDVLGSRVHFHYWVALDAGPNVERNSVGLKHNHLGILIYSKNNSLASLNVKDTRFPHMACLACGHNVKDWGGKKHLMNLNGTGLSDVWKDLYKVTGKINDPVISRIKLNKLDLKQSVFGDNLSCPKEIKERIRQLIKGATLNEITIDKKFLNKINDASKAVPKIVHIKNGNELDNKILLGDCIEEMEELAKKYPDGIFDLVFADPPYNLAKNYKEYDDEKSAVEYENWCNRWIELSVKLTKPGGSIFVLNIPRWGLSHSKVLNKNAYFRNWIVWDALSTPKGKIMPAHYSLLYYTKGASTPTFNVSNKIDPISYCLRITCQKEKKDDQKHINNKVDVSEIWSDLHRIKHKKDRDDHPCQLPHKLMDRIIQMFSNKDDLIFDPFGGAGTTGICAVKNNRKFLLTELDPYYKEISEKRIFETLSTGDTIRKTTKKSNQSKYTKRFLETKVQELSNSLNRKPTLEEFTSKFNIDLEEIKKLYPEPHLVLKAGRIGLLNQKD
jgi:site-specific DNA-methyltransferase (adenine-specific)